MYKRVTQSNNKIKIPPIVYGASFVSYHIVKFPFVYNGKDEVCGLKFKVRTEYKHCQPEPMPQIKQLDFDELR